MVNNPQTKTAGRSPPSSILVRLILAEELQDALLRLETLVGLTGRTVAERTLRQMICASLDVIIQLTRLPNGRRAVS